MRDQESPNVLTTVCLSCANSYPACVSDHHSDKAEIRLLRGYCSGRVWLMPGVANAPVGFPLRQGRPGPPAPTSTLNGNSVNPSRQATATGILFFLCREEFSKKCGQNGDKTPLTKKAASIVKCQPLDFTGTPGPTRTGGLRIRSPTLYPTELRAHVSTERARRCSAAGAFVPSSIRDGGGKDKGGGFHLAADGVKSFP